MKKNVILVDGAKVVKRAIRAYKKSVGLGGVTAKTSYITDAHGNQVKNVYYYRRYKRSMEEQMAMLNLDSSLLPSDYKVQWGEEYIKHRPKGFGEDKISVMIDEGLIKIEGKVVKCSEETYLYLMKHYGEYFKACQVITI